LNKLPVFNWFIAMGDVLITVETKAVDVDIPLHLRQNETVDFILGQVPTPKLTVDEGGVTAPMRFGGTLHTCRFPWGSIRQMASPVAVMQFSNVPPTDAHDTGAGKKGGSKKKGGHLRVVK
jgi:hypothetical protein